MEAFMGNFAVNFLVNHQEFFQGAILGVVLSNPGLCARLIFGAFIKVPGVGKWVARNPEKAKAWFDGFKRAIDDAVDKYDREHPELDEAPPAPAAATKEPKK